MLSNQFNKHGLHNLKRKRRAKGMRQSRHQEKQLRLKNWRAGAMNLIGGTK